MIEILSESKLNRATKTNLRNNFQIQKNINSLIKHYLAKEELHERLKDLPSQFKQPQPRAWKPINWQSINREQVSGIDLRVFLSVIVGAMDTEAPIRGYTQTSRQYFQKLHPQMAQYVGGTIDENEKLIETRFVGKRRASAYPCIN